MVLHGALSQSLRSFLSPLPKGARPVLGRPGGGPIA